MKEYQQCGGDILSCQATGCSEPRASDRAQGAHNLAKQTYIMTRTPGVQWKCLSRCLLQGVFALSTALNMVNFTVIDIPTAQFQQETRLINTYLIYLQNGTGRGYQLNH
jgi:hypothetical protein